MTPDEQRIAIAWATGRRWNRTSEVEDASVLRVLPDYLNDLNACHEFEKTLDDDKVKFEAYAHRICMAPIIVEGESTTLFDEWGWYGLLKATAAQRCEAFLRTFGSWRD